MILFETDKKPLTFLLDQVDQGQLALPDFQRSFGRTVRHWVRPLMGAPEDGILLRRRLLQEEAALIQRWNLRQTGWNRS